jgi:hypothetical protein
LLERPADAWRDTELALAGGGRYRNVFTGEEVHVPEGLDSGLRAAELFAHMPVAVLVDESFAGRGDESSAAESPGEKRSRDAESAGGA